MRTDVGNSRIRQWAESPWLVLTPIMAVALVFRLYDLDAVTVWGDEFQDVRFSIVHAENPNPFGGPPWLCAADPSQARLPYYLTAIGIRLLSGGNVETFLKHAGHVEGTGTLGWTTTLAAVGLVCILFTLAAPPPLGRWAGVLPAGCVLLMVLILGLPRFPVSQLVAGRIVSGLVGAGAVLAVYVLGREVFGHWAGLFAAGTLAFCPTHIGWSRCCVTAGDTFVTTFWTLALWLLYRTVKRGTGPTMMACAASFGVALAAKASAILLWPICVLYVFVLWVGRMQIGEASSLDTSGDRLWRATHLHLGLVVLLAVLVPSPLIHGPTTSRIWIWLIALAIYVRGLVLLARPSWSVSRRHLAWVALNILVGGIVVAAFTTPYHLRNEVLGGLADWWREWGSSRDVARTYLTEFVQMAGLAAVQAEVPINLLAIGGLVMACRPRNLRWGSLLVLSLVLYLVAITVIRHKFTYYVMPALPTFHVLAAGAVCWLLGRLGGRRAITLVVAAVVFAPLAFELHRTVALHPHYLLGDRQWERSLTRWSDPRPVNLQVQALRPALGWLAGQAASGSRIGLLLPGGLNFNVNYRGWFNAVLDFETQRLPPDPSKELLLQTVVDPRQIDESNYLICFPFSWGDKPWYPGFVQVHEVGLNGLPGAWIFKRH